MTNHPYTLRPLSYADKAAFEGLVKNDIDYAYWRLNKKTPLETTIEYIEGANACALGLVKNVGLTAICDTTEGEKLIGCTCILPKRDAGWAEIGFFLHPDYQGLKIGSWAALNAVVQARRDFHVTNLWATVHPDNKPCLSILEKFGMRRHLFVEQSQYPDKNGNPEPRWIYQAQTNLLYPAIARLQANPPVPRALYVPEKNPQP